VTDPRAPGDGDVRRTTQTLGAGLRRAGVEWAKEVGPTFLVLLGFCLGALGALQHSQGASALAYDDHLRAAGGVTTGVIIDVETYQQFSATRGRGSTTYYLPVTRQIVAGVTYVTRLDEYEITNDRDFYQVGDTVSIMYDPADPDVAGIKSDVNRSFFDYKVASGRNIALPGVVAFIIGTPFLCIQMARYVAMRVRTRETRKWAEARRRVKRARRAAERVAGTHAREGL
jgi:hypothetical protein